MVKPEKLCFGRERYTSLRPMITWSLGALGQEPSGTSSAPTSENSESRKIRTGLCSTLTLKPAEMRDLVVEGVRAERYSRGLVSLLTRIELQ